jgi:hypothetical protein
MKLINQVINENIKNEIFLNFEIQEIIIQLFYLLKMILNTTLV